MTDTQEGDPGLPSLENLARWIRRTREELGLTQTEVGERANLSPSQLSRLESAQGNPSYEAVHRVYSVLKDEVEETDAAEILREKHGRDDDTPDLEYASPRDTCLEVSETMDRYGISQLPVFDDDGVSVGSVTEADLVDVQELGEVEVREVSGEPFPEVSRDGGESTVRRLLSMYPAVLVVGEDEGEGRYVGILTRADLHVTG